MQGNYYQASFSIEADANSISFVMKGEALSDFKKNRNGLCVHHPLKECIGRKVIITQPDETVYESVFPELISPHQPFLNVQQIEWTLMNGVVAQLNFEGEIFETEDHREWTDSSYKTYSTPLHLPFLLQLKADEKIEQRITLTVSRKNAKSLMQHGLLKDMQMKN